MENVEVIKPQPRTLDRVHGEYAGMSAAERENKARAKLQERINKGRENAVAALARVEREVPVDAVVRATALKVWANADGKFKLGQIGDAAGHLGDFHEHALGQVAERAGFPRKYLGELRGTDWGRDLVGRNLSELLAHQDDDAKFLVRRVDGVVRGVLGRNYRTDDSRPALQAIMEVARVAGAVMIDGYALDTRCSFRIVKPEPIEVFPGEWAIIGADYRTSDYGNGGRELRGFIERLLCLNGASVTAQFRRVHIGAQLDETTFSNRTRKLNEDFTRSAMTDAAKALLGADAIKGMIERVREANATELDADKALASLRKVVGKAEEKLIVDKYNSPDVEMLPPGNTAWRFSNAISWLANQDGMDADRKLDLQVLAGSFVGGAGEKQAA